MEHNCRNTPDLAHIHPQFPAAFPTCHPALPSRRLPLPPIAFRPNPDSLKTLKASSKGPNLEYGGWRTVTTDRRPPTISRYEPTCSHVVLVIGAVILVGDQGVGGLLRRWQVVVPAHPLISHWISVLRDRSSPSHAFSECCAFFYCYSESRPYSWYVVLYW